jgi:hypothetical protein
MAGLIALTCLASLNILAESSVPSRVTQRIDESKSVTLAGHTLPFFNAKTDRGPVSDNLDLDHIHMVLKRSAAQEKELNQLMEEQADKNSPNFHKWLTAEEFGARFGVSQEDIDQITGWLESHGFRVNQVYPNHMFIDFSGNAGQMKNAFHTEIHNIELKSGMHIANASDPQIPAALASVVTGIASLNDIRPKPMHEKKVSQYTFAGCDGDCYGMTPQDNQTIYGLNPLYSSGVSGQGQTIYLVEDTDTYGAAGTNGASDWNTYRSTFGLSTAFPLGSYSQTHPGSCADPGTNGDDGEAAIDVEVASSVAPSAAIQLISCPSGTVTFGGQIALQNLINEASPTLGVVSVSYGICEALNGNGGNAAFYNTYQQAAAEGFSVFVSAGDEGPSSCSNEFSAGSEYDVASLGVTGWGETPYNVTVGGTDFEDLYNSVTGGLPQSTYWSSTNTAGYGSALSYVPEIPWNDACASTLLSDALTGSFLTYGSTGTCNNKSFDTSTTYLSTGAGSGGASNCALGQGGANTEADALTTAGCQGYPKPSWQAGTSLNGGVAVYGVPNDGVRDIPDVSMFAANGVWGHYEVVCWSDPSYTADGAASCASAPSTWAGFGGTSVASPTMAAIQALINQKTGESWGNPNPYYYQLAQNEYGTSGGTFKGTACNSSGSGGPASTCPFNDVTQGDIDLACENNGSLEEAHCYDYTARSSKTAVLYGVDSTDNVTAATVLYGGSGYTTAPTCTIAGPTNNQPYKTPTGTVLYAGGTQATCTATVAASTTTAVWTITLGTGADTEGQSVVITNPAGTVTCGPYTIASVSSTTTQATDLVTAIGTGCSLASATSSKGTVTLTAKATGATGNFVAQWGTAELFNNFGGYITNTTKGQGPNYVSGITISTDGSGYQPQTPITLTGAGSGAVAVANTSIGTAAQSYQPTYGAAPGYDLATGLGSPNANALVNASIWYTPQTIDVTTPAPSSAVYGSQFTVAATATSGLAVTYASAGSCSNSGATYTITSGTGTCSVIFNQAGGGKYSAAPTVTESVSAGIVSGTTVISATPTSLTGSVSAGWSLTVVLANSGTGTAENVDLSTATVGGVAPKTAASSIPYISPGGTATVTLSYPGSAASSGKSAVVLSGTYTGGTFSSLGRVTDN